MALAHFQRTFTDQFGNVKGGLSVEVRRESDGMLVALYSNEAGSTSKSNPFNTDVNGYGDFYVADGRYRIQAVDANIDWRDQDLISQPGVSGDIAQNASDINQRTIYAGTVAAMEALSLPVGTNVYLTQEGRAGEFVVKSGTHAVDTYKGIFIDLANGNYAERTDKVNITPEMFGAVGDNVANDWPRSLAAFDFAKANHKKITFDGSKSYYLGVFPDSGQEIKFNIDVDNMRVETNGCTFRVDVSLLNDPASSNQVLFQNYQASNTWVGDFEAIGDQIQKSPSRIGYIAFNIHNATASSSNLTLGSISCEKALAGIQATTANASLYRHVGVRAASVRNLDAYYGINCANNADDFTGFSVYTTSAVRSYFVYGVSNHKGLVHSVDHATASDVLIARYVRDTSNIDIAYKADNDLSNDQSIRGAFVTDDTNAVIRNVMIKADVEKADPAGSTLGFIAYDSTGGTLQTTTTNIFDGWTVTGRTNSNEVASLSFVSGMTGNARSVVNIDKEIFKSTQNTKGFICNSGTQAQYATANSDTDLEMDFKIRGVLFTVPQIARLTVSAFDNGTSNTGEYFARELWVLFRLGSDGSVTITTTSTISTFTAGALAPTLSVDNQAAGTYSLKVKVNNYTGANRFVKGTLDLFAYAEAV